MDYEELREGALNIDCSEIIKGCNVEDDWVAFKKVIINIRNRDIPRKHCKVWFKAKQVTTEVNKCHR